MKSRSIRSPWRSGAGFSAALRSSRSGGRAQGRTQGAELRASRSRDRRFAATGSISILAAFRTTSVAHVAIIYATAPLVSAGLSRVLLRDHIAPWTIGAGFAALLGVAITIGGTSEGHLVGDAFAMLMTLSLSLMAVLARRSVLRSLTTSVVSVVFTCGFALAVGSLSGSVFVIGWRDAGWLAGFGLVTMSLAWTCYLAGAARVPPATTMLLSAAELPLAPLWVWLAFGEMPVVRTVLGGAVVALAVLAELGAGSMINARLVGRASSSFEVG